MVVFGAAFGACGGDDSDAGGNGGDQVDDAADGGPDDGGSDDGDSGGSSGDVPTFPDATFNTGTGEMSATGDAEDSFELSGTATTLDGFTSIVFLSDRGSFTITTGGDMDPAMAVSVGTIATTASLTKDCDFEVTKNDTTALEGSFDCGDLQAVAPGTTDIKHINVQGSFSLTP